MGARDRWLRVGAALGVGTIVAALITSCTAEGAGATRASSAWDARMQTVLYDPDGQGALSGDLPGGGDLMSVKRGSYVLVAACIGADVVHVAARADGELIGASDVPCGATVTIPISYESSHGLDLRVTRHGPTSTGSWYVSVNRASWVRTTSDAF